MTLEINGRSVFAKGSNWVCPDIFPSNVKPERYEALLAVACSAHFNIVRVWGGAMPPHDYFYQRCDELGILVWQEFPLACNAYPDDPDYLRILDQESRSLITRLRSHACLALWCGGNELFNAWSRMTDQALPLRLLNRNTFELDPQRPFIPTAPIGGMAHGNYIFRDHNTGEEAWEQFQGAAYTAYSEFGCPAPAHVETLRSIIPNDQLWPPAPGTAWESHHAFNAWLPDGWLHREIIERYFGTCANLEQLVSCGQRLQGIGLQGLFEEVRRQKPRASMALNWCLGEPWPCAANSSIVGWPDRPKPSIQYITQACRDTLASARIPKLKWTSGEIFTAELWLLNDSPEPIPAADIIAHLDMGGSSRQVLTWHCGGTAPNENAQGPQISVRLPDDWTGEFCLRLTVAHRSAWDSTYSLIVAPAQSDANSGARLNF